MPLSYLEVRREIETYTDQQVEETLESRRRHRTPSLEWQIWQNELKRAQFLRRRKRWREARACEREATQEGSTEEVPVAAGSSAS